MVLVVVAPVVRDGAESLRQGFPTTVAAAEHSSTSSAESSFRELDDVFLQTQAKIWLGEVLQARFDEHLHVADLLADGQILFEVAREIWKLLTKNGMDTRCVKAHKCEPFACRKRSGRYTPYSNVDSFLKICKILGLSGIDLFSPSDVVEKRDTRKVCICIRSLSRKARSRYLNVPDFDSVTYTIAMPTDMVGCIRRSWELSHYSSSSSASHNKYHRPRGRLTQKHLDASSSQKYDSDSEESDHAESNFMLQSANSDTSCSCDISSNMKSELMSSPEVSSSVRDYFFNQFSLDVSYTKQHADQCIKHEDEGIWFNGSRVPVHSHQCERDDQLDSSLSSIHSDVQLGYRASSAEDRVRNGSENIALVDPTQEDVFSVVGDSSEGQTPGENNFNDESAILGTTCSKACYGETVQLDEEDRTSHQRTNDSCASIAIRRNLDDERRSEPSVAGDVEASSVAGMNSVSGILRHLDFSDNLEAEDDVEASCFAESPNNKTVSTREFKAGSESQGTSLLEDHRSTSHGAEETPPDMKVMDSTFFHPNHSLTSSATESNAVSAEYVNCSSLHDDDICPKKINSNVVHHQESEFPTDQSSSSDKVCQWDQKGKCKVSVVPVRNDVHESSPLSPSQLGSYKEAHQFAQSKAREDAYNDGKQQDGLLKVGKDDPSRTQDIGVVGETEEKPRRRPLLKSVARGTAVVGVLLFLFHLRGSSRDKKGEAVPQSNNETREGKGGELSSQKEQKGSTRNGAYPAEKFKF